MSDRWIRQFAVSLALIVFAVVKFYEASLPDWAVFITPGAAPYAIGTSLQLLSAAWSGIKLGILIVLAEHVLYRIFAGRMIGRWAYASSSGNYAVADIRPRGFWAGGTSLTYNVSLFKTAEEAIAAMKRQGTTAPFGTAEGILVGFKEEKITIIYQVSVGAHAFDARKGILFLTLTADPDIVKGVWESTKINDKLPTVADRDVRTGDLILYRTKRFIAAFENRA